MTDLTALPALLARVEAATGPDREMDWAIHDYFFGKHPGAYEHGISAGHYTSSLDATVALVEARLKHAATVHLTINIGAAQHDCAIDLAENEKPGDAVTCRTPPLALLAALLRSMIEEEGK